MPNTHFQSISQIGKLKSQEIKCNAQDHRVKRVRVGTETETVWLQSLYPSLPTSCSASKIVVTYSELSLAKFA